MQQRSISVTNGTRIRLIGLHFLEKLGDTALLKSLFKKKKKKERKLHTYLLLIKAISN